MGDDTEEDGDYGAAELELMPSEKIKKIIGKAMNVLKKRDAKKRNSKPLGDMTDEEFREYADKRMSNKRG